MPAHPTRVRLFYLTGGRDEYTGKEVRDDHRKGYRGVAEDAALWSSSSRLLCARVRLPLFAALMSTRKGRKVSAVFALSATSHLTKHYYSCGSV